MKRSGNGKGEERRRAAQAEGAEAWGDSPCAREGRVPLRGLASLSAWVSTHNSFVFNRYPLAHLRLFDTV